MNILSCISVMNELNLSLYKVKNFFKNQTLLKVEEKLIK